MARIDKNKSGKAAPLLAAGLLVALCAASPARAQTPAPQGETAFGQEMPKQYFINRLTNPSRETIEQSAREEAEAKPTTSREPGKPAASIAPGSGASPSAAGAAPSAGETTGAQAADNGNYYDPYPNKFLLNRMFGSGGGQ